MDLTVPQEYQSHLAIGACSWKYDTWKGLLYDYGTHYHADDYLVDYSRYLKTVEVDQWFWSLFPGEVKMPATGTVATYAASVPADFQFSVKAPNAITLTHHYAKQTANNSEWSNRVNDRFLDVDLVYEFVDHLSGLGDRLGPVMFQFEYLNQRKMPSADAFFSRLEGFLQRLPDGVDFAVEIRNPNFLTTTYFDLLRKYGIGVVLLDGYYLPPVRHVFETFDTATANFSVVRLHGPDRAGIEKRTRKDWSKVAEPKDDGARCSERLAKPQCCQERKDIRQRQQSL